MEVLSLGTLVVWVGHLRHGCLHLVGLLVHRDGIAAVLVVRVVATCCCGVGLLVWILDRVGVDVHGLGLLCRADQRLFRLHGNQLD